MKSFLLLTIASFACASACSPVKDPPPPTIKAAATDGYGCPVPPDGHENAKIDGGFDALKIGAFSLGKLEGHYDPRFVRFISQASSDDDHIAHIVCVAAKSGQESTPRQQNRLRELLLLMRTTPSPETLVAWMRENPRPEDAGGTRPGWREKCLAHDDDFTACREASKALGECATAAPCAWEKRCYDDRAHVLEQRAVLCQFSDVVSIARCHDLHAQLEHMRSTTCLALVTAGAKPDGGF